MLPRALLARHSGTDSASESSRSESWHDGSYDSAEALVPVMPDTFGVTQIVKQVMALLLEFPSAAIDGVRWSVLTDVFGNCHGLDLRRLDPMTLIWEGVRWTSRTDGEFAIAADDALVLEPSPDSLGHWPALYLACCEAVWSMGSEMAVESAKWRCLPVAMLQPLLRQHYHTDFGDCRLAFLLAEDGSMVQVDGTVDLVLALLEWRNHRVEWQQDRNVPFSAVDVVLLPQIRLSHQSGTEVICCCGYVSSSLDNQRCLRLTIS